MTNWFEWNDDDEGMVASFMTRVAALPAATPALDPMQLWWKAQLLRRWDAQRRAQAPIDIMQPVEIAAGLACAGVLLYLSLPLLF